MRLLITSLHFDAHAEGICTGRLVRALLNEGTQITLVTSDDADTSYQHPNLRSIVLQNVYLPRKLFSLVNRITGTPGSYYFWCRRVAALAPQLTGHDLVYGRSAPISSAEACRRLAGRLRQPYWVHYSDPFPYPWVGSGTPLFRRQAAYSREVLNQAGTITFTTREALKFQERSTELELERKSFVLQHIGPEPAWLAKNSDQSPVFAYIGSFYGKRNANALLEGFSAVLKTHPKARFVFVGSNPAWVLPEAERLGVAAAVEVTPRVKDVQPCMANADVLVALDADCGEPVFMTTKIVEYLLVNRPVLMVTTANSPSAQLVRRFPTSTVLVNEASDAIASGLDQALKLSPSDAEYRNRFKGMHDFTAAGVAKTFLSEVARRGRPSR